MTSPTHDEIVLKLVAEYGHAVAEATKSQGAALGKNRKERAAARLLKKILHLTPTDKEVDEVIPG